jgi:predicted kinase
MIGVAGSGKSYWAHEFGKLMSIKVFSSDQMRKKLYGSEEVQKNPRLVFDKLYAEAGSYVKRGHSVIIDATNLTPKVRKNIFKAFEDYDCEFIAIVMNTDLEVCLKRNVERNRHVPQEVIEKMYKRMTAPSPQENFSYIKVIDCEENVCPLM